MPNGCLSGAPPAAVLRRSDTLLLPEHTAEVLRIFESEAVGHLRDALSGGEPVLGKLDHEPADVVAGRVAGRLPDDVAEVVGREPQLVSWLKRTRMSEFSVLRVWNWRL